ncbi:MAG TPA: hypothetical protein VE093_16005 [Polyangiaceae bacterium]|jgi:hypothetical protein|nr:hypothetical protein [Polyangiaceae bacterium]
MEGTKFATDSLHADSFLFALRVRLEEAPTEAIEDACAGAAAWTGFVFSALARAAADCGMVSCAARHATAASRAEPWALREHLFDVTWFRHDCTDWDTPFLILEHENAWDRRAFLVDFWKLLVGYAPVRVMIGYSRRAFDHDPWISEVNEILSSKHSGVRLPDGVDDVILLGHRGMTPSGYAVYRRRQRCFVRTGDSLSSVLMPDPSDAAAWEAYIRKTQVEAEQRVHNEVDRLRRANIVDYDGRIIPETTPPDMDPAAGTSTVTG